MSSFTITVEDKQVQAALQAVSARVNNMEGVLTKIGIGIVERTQQRFNTSTAPDGTPWAPYPPTGATISMLTERIAGSKSNRKKDGSLNSRGATQLGGKKLLIDSTHLKNSFRRQVIGDALIVSSTQAYAAMHQFGGTTSPSSMIPGKTIPARPFLPIKQDGSLYPAEQAEVLATINEYLMDNLGSK